MRAITIQGSYVGSLPEMRELIELVRRTGLPPVPVATRPLDDVNAVLERSARRQGRRPRGADAGRLIAPIIAPKQFKQERSTMDAAELRAMQAPIKDSYKSDPERGADHAEGQGHARRQQHRLQGRDRPRARGRGPASGDRRLGHGAVLRRHAAGGAGGLRRRDAEGGFDRARHSAEVRHGVGRRRSRFSRHARRRQGRAGRLSRRSGCASTSTPTRRRTSSTSCSSSPSAIAWSIRPSPRARRWTSRCSACDIACHDLRWPASVDVMPALSRPSTSLSRA